MPALHVVYKAAAVSARLRPHCASYVSAECGLIKATLLLLQLLPAPARRTARGLRPGSIVEKEVISLDNVLILLTNLGYSHTIFDTAQSTRVPPQLHWYPSPSLELLGGWLQALPLNLLQPACS